MYSLIHFNYNNFNLILSKVQINSGSPNVQTSIPKRSMFYKFPVMLANRFPQVPQLRNKVFLTQRSRRSDKPGLGRCFILNQVS